MTSHLRGFSWLPFAFAVAGATCGLIVRGATVDVTIDTTKARQAISPYIYGSNADLPGVTVTARRQGGNRMTGYNWENNASNAGIDYLHSSDDYLTSMNGITGADATVPGKVMTYFHDQSIAAGVPYTLLTLQMAGYVAADKNGVVQPSEAAPSARWIPVQDTKPTAFATTPATNDGAVYMDEMVNFLVQKYGPATSAHGVKGYDLDNEPDLWSNTHPRIHPAQPTAVELISRSVDLAKAVKRVDPTAETFGFVSYGFTG